MYKYFADIQLDNEEMLSEERIGNIKTSVLSRVKEEKAMSKRTTIRTITIAVAAATTAALSAMIASAEPSAWTPAAAIEEENEKPGEAAFKEYIEKAKAEDVGAPEKAPENVNGWIAVDADTSDLVCVQPVNDWTVYYYFRGDDEQLQEKLSNGWTLIDEDINVIHENEVFVDD